MLERDFYLRDARVVAEELLGKCLVHRTGEGVAAGMIVETEAYVGPEDKGAHSYGGRRTVRTEAMFGEGGHAYIYLIYGMYHCFNVVAGAAGRPEAVLVRALEPVDGIELMFKRQATARKKAGDISALCRGPGKLCLSMGLTKENYGQDLCGDTLYIQEYKSVERPLICVSPRINIDYAEEYRDVPWRYYIKGNPSVSRVPRRYRGTALADNPADDAAAGAEGQCRE